MEEKKSSKPKSMTVFFVFEHGMPEGSWECDVINDDDDDDNIITFTKDNT